MKLRALALIMALFAARYAWSVWLPSAASTAASALAPSHLVGLRKALPELTRANPRKSSEIATLAAAARPAPSPAPLGAAWKP